MLWQFVDSRSYPIPLTSRTFIHFHFYYLPATELDHYIQSNFSSFQLDSVDADIDKEIEAIKNALPDVFSSQNLNQGGEKAKVPLKAQSSYYREKASQSQQPPVTEQAEKEMKAAPSQNNTQQIISTTSSDNNMKLNNSYFLTGVFLLSTMLDIYVTWLYYEGPPFILPLPQNKFLFRTMVAASLFVISLFVVPAKIYPVAWFMGVAFPSYPFQLKLMSIALLGILLCYSYTIAIDILF
jgi:hypothetical protein